MLSLQLDPASAQQHPQTAPLIRELVMFGVRAFPVASFPATRSLEAAFEEAFKTLLQSPPPPLPKGNTKWPMEIQPRRRSPPAGSASASSRIRSMRRDCKCNRRLRSTSSRPTPTRRTQCASSSRGVLRAAELGQDAQELRVKTLLDQARA
jgi:hypothetical protein